MYLNCHTYYSLRYGTLSPKQLVEAAVRCGVRQMALTDINNCTAMPEFVQQCRQQGIKPVAGMEFRQNGRLLYIALAHNNEGFRHINAFRSKHNIEKKPLPPRFPVCAHSVAIYPFHGNRPLNPGPHEYTGIRPSELHHLRNRSPRHDPGKMVMLHPVSFGDDAGHQLHRHLRAIDHNSLLSRPASHNTAPPDQVMIRPKNLKQAYKGFPHIIRNTAMLLEQCDIGFDFHTFKNKKTFTGHPADDKSLLEKLSTDGLIRRYGKQNREALSRVQNELEIIHKLGFSAYFLITWDIIRYSMSRGFHHVGRGSGANSIVAYCLHITDVDPIELDLYFERFINPKRSTPPDFDIDYSWQERDQVLDYIFKRYGQAHTALLGTISTFHRRSALRELGKVYGLTKAEIDALTEGGHTARCITDRVTTQVLDVAQQLTGYPNLRSIHAGGVLVSEKPICYYSALDMPPKGMPVVQWDMYVAEELGFEKIDILSQRGIGHINECIRLVRENQGKDTDIHRMAHIKEDRQTKALLRKGETTGCFYVESPAMRGLIKKLGCNDYLGLVAASSIIRPGVSRSGMMQEYIRRTHQPEKTTYLHPVMEAQLKETHGVMVYQEDVIKVCHHFAGLDLADADVLRRAMSGKYRSTKEMQRLTGRFFEGCRAKGHPDSLAAEVWRQIESFAGYSFSKAHSASFAAESFQSLYLKAHYPLEFMTAVINNFGGFYRSEIYFHEAQRHGARIELPCINHSRYLNRICGKTIYIGFIHIRHLEHKTAEKICFERQENGPYSGLDDFIRRTGPGLEQLIILIRAMAFRFTDISKSKLLWQAHLLAGKEKNNNPRLFTITTRSFTLPEPETAPLLDAYDEMELLGFVVSMDPFDLLQTSFRGEIFAHNMRAHTGRTVRMLGRLVATKYVRTIKNEVMFFGCFIDCKGRFFDTVHFPDVCRAYPFRGNGIYLLKGEITCEFSQASMLVQKMARLAIKPDPRGPGGSAQHRAK